MNFKKEIRPFIPRKADHERREEADDDCSDILMVSESTAITAHNEDANVALLGHTYVVVIPIGQLFCAHSMCTVLIVPACTDRGFSVFSYLVKATSPDGASSFTAYTYAGELPTCAFGFNSNGVVRLVSSEKQDL